MVPPLLRRLRPPLLLLRHAFEDIRFAFRTNLIVIEVDDVNFVNFDFVSVVINYEI